jgi:uncharacterized phage infection (PIP) family protein YhgE
MSDLEKIVESNAKAIASLTSDIQEFTHDREHMYGIMRDLSQNQARIYDVLLNLDKRQQQLTDQQRQLTDQQRQLTDQQGQLIEILNRLSNGK